jgi:DNA-binding transcriptional regulator YhcF (GntR family)
MNVVVDATAPTPAYEQIRQQIACMVGSGVLSPGTRLPTIQQLANDLELAPGTVARAYKELERDGVVISRRRAGTTISEAPPRAAHRAIAAELEEAAQRFVLSARQLGADPDHALSEVRRLLAAAT